MTAGRSNSNSLSQHWCTPPKYAEAINEFYSGSVSLDPCSNCHSVIDAEIEFYLPKTDGLMVPWNFPRIFVNPPYGRDKQRGTSIYDWFKKCAESNSHYNSEVLALVPVATNTRHWKRFVFGVATGVAFLYDTRLRFLENGVDSGKGAPMACAMIYWGSKFNRFERVFIEYGAVIDVRNLHGKRIGEIRAATSLNLTN